MFIPLNLISTTLDSQAMKKKKNTKATFGTSILMSWKKIQDVAVIGITDYFSIEGYKKVLEYRQKGRLQNFDLILPNIEFRLDKLISSRKDEEPKRLNFHVIFSNEIEPEKIEKEFLEELHIKTNFQ